MRPTPRSSVPNVSLPIQSTSRRRKRQRVRQDEAEDDDALTPPGDLSDRTEMDDGVPSVYPVPLFQRAPALYKPSVHVAENTPGQSPAKVVTN